MAIPAKPWSVATFETQRSHLTTFVKERIIPLLEDDVCRRIIIRAPVKSGKREMVEYMAMRDQVRDARRVHAFLSAWHRAADADQRIELGEHEMKVFSITTAANVKKCTDWVEEQIAAGKHVVLHLDECDHGSGSKQMLSNVWTKVRDNDHVTNILYSATPEEVLFSGEVDDEEHQAVMDQMIQEGHHVRYTPPEGYCGPAAFLAAGLVHEAKPFFTKTGGAFTLTDQGKEIVRDLRTALETDPARNMIVLRLSYSDLGGIRAEKKENKAIYQFLKNLASFPELADFLVVVDKSDEIKGIRNAAITAEKIQWSNPTYWRRQAVAIPTIIVIDQTSSRSTEWACHGRIFATHDYRNTLLFSVVSQAQERVNHYRQKYGGVFQPIRVYGHKKTFQLSADQIDYETYLKNEWTMRKVDRRTAGDAVLYTIKSTSPGGALHPVFKERYSEERATQILQDLASYAEVAVSARVAGGIKTLPVYDSVFIPCSQANFAARLTASLPRIPGVRTRRDFRNPFETSAANPNGGQTPEGKWRGYLREWGVFQFDRIRHERWGAACGDRLTICYRGEELGVAFRYNTDRTERVDSLRAYKSMYA
jgi:hypothetical protein